MDNPWATTWDHPQRPHDRDTSWSTSQWPATQATVWLQSDASWDPSTNATLEQDIIARDQGDTSPSPILITTEPRSATGDSISDHPSTRATSPLRDLSGPVPETTDPIRRDVRLVARVSDEENLNTALSTHDNGWSTAWGNIRFSDTNVKETQTPDQWEAARQGQEKLDRAVPPGLLDSLLRRCQEVSQEIWPASESSNEENWGPGLDGHADIVTLLALLAPSDATTPSIIQFPATATAKAMNEALKQTRHLPESASSPLSCLLASKGSLEWEKSIKAKLDVPDTTHVGWRVLEKEDRLNTLEESKPRKVTGGLLSFWNRRASAIQAAPIETPNERTSSPVRSSLEGVKSTLHPPSSRAVSPSKVSTTSVSPPRPAESQPAVVATALAPSAVSRFLSRFSRARGVQHSSLALSSDDLEYLSDIVPSASDPPDEDINDGALDMVTGASNSSLHPPKLPPPIPPPPRQSLIPGRPSSDGTPAVRVANRTPNVSFLAPQLSPKPAASLSRTQCPPLPLKDVAAPIVAPRQLIIPSLQQTVQPSSRINSRPHSLPPHKTPLLSIPPLLPPPSISPPQTPRPSNLPLMAPDGSSTMRSTDGPSFYDSYDFDDEFSAFTSFPPSAPAQFSSSEPYSFPRPPSPPSPPPRRSYGRTHFPSSSTSSILSPTSQTSLDQLHSTSSPVSTSLDSFDDFVSPPPVVRSENRKRTPSPPPLPVKPQFEHRQPLHLDTSSRVHTPSQTFSSPPLHTGLANSSSTVPSVSNAEHQRTQNLVNNAVARGGILWPNSPDVDEPRVRAIPPPPSTSTSPKLLIGQEGFDLLGDDTIVGGFGTLPVPLSVVEVTEKGPGTSPPTSSVSNALFGVASSAGKGLGLRSQLQPSLPPLLSASAPIPPFSSLGNPVPLASASSASLQPTKSKQTVGLSAQDLSFFEGL